MLRETPIRRTSLVDEIGARLQEDILAGKYRPGEALPPERELSERYGVTRTSLKHALVRLEELGLIETRHGVGSIVLDVEQSGGADLLKYLAPSAEGSRDGSFFSEILEAKTAVCASFVELAAERRTEKELSEAQSLLLELSEKIGDAREVQRIEHAFVKVLARAAHNRAFVLLTNSVGAAYSFYWGKYQSVFEDGEWVEENLKAILEAVRKKDAPRARELTQKYFRENDRRVLDVLGYGKRK